MTQKSAACLTNAYETLVPDPAGQIWPCGGKGGGQPDVRKSRSAWAGTALLSCADDQLPLKVNTVPANLRIPGRYHFAIFVLACATLAFQILITRFFSVMLYYHFPFAAISLAMLGLTRGAMEVYNKPERYASDAVAGEFARHAAWFAISG